jgi:hypothetical protein
VFTLHYVIVCCVHICWCICSCRSQLAPGFSAEPHARIRCVVTKVCGRILSSTFWYVTPPVSSASVGLADAHLTITSMLMLSIVMISRKLHTLDTQLHCVLLHCTTLFEMLALQVLKAECMVIASNLSADLLANRAHWHSIKPFEPCSVYLDEERASHLAAAPKEQSGIEWLRNDHNAERAAAVSMLIRMLTLLTTLLCKCY